MCVSMCVCETCKLKELICSIFAQECMQPMKQSIGRHPLWLLARTEWQQQHDVKFFFQHLRRLTCLHTPAVAPTTTRNQTNSKPFLSHGPMSFSHQIVIQKSCFSFGPERCSDSQHTFTQIVTWGRTRCQNNNFKDSYKVKTHGGEMRIILLKGGQV